MTTNPGRAAERVVHLDPPPPGLASRVQQALRTVPPAPATHPTLPQSSLDVLHDLAAGYTSKQIAVRRHLSRSAVAQRIYRANQHLGTSTAAQAVYEATVRGLIQLRPAPKD